ESMPAKSVSREGTFAHDVADAAALRSVLRSYCESVGAELREAGRRGRTVTLKLRYASFRTLTRAHTLAEPTDLDAVIYQTALKLFRRAWDRRQKVRLLGVAASALGATAGQPSLFDAERQARLEKLARAADQVRGCHGTDAVRTAKSLLRKTHS
ncbi:MAG TPA: hypothetical protein VJ085_08060, partial [Candidatus Acidoferrales bacterium]|nr:hypothetical protein [Candidatus Acidoferrales bacterium]